MHSNGIQYYEFRRIRFDYSGCSLVINGESIPLTKKSSELLRRLVEVRHRTVSKQELLNSVWDDRFVEEATLTQHIYMLRRALGKDNSDCIRVVPKLGYRFVAEVSEIRLSDPADSDTPRETPTVAFSTNVSSAEPMSSTMNAPLGIRQHLSRRFYSERGLLPIAARLLAFLLVVSPLLFLRSDSTSMQGDKDRQVKLAAVGFSQNAEANKYYFMGLQSWDAVTEEGLLAAIPFFEKAISIDADFVLAYADLADTYALIGHYEIDSIPKSEAMSLARKYATKALELNPNCSEALTSLAIVEAGEKHIDESFRLLHESIKLKPGNPIPYQRLAWLYASVGKMDAALDSMDAALRLSPQSRSINLGMASLLNILGRPIDSMQFSRRVLELDAGNSSARLELAEALEQIKGYEIALAELDKIAEDQKAYTEARVVSSRLYAKTNRLSEARNVLKTALVKPGIENLGYQVALTYSAIGKTDEAIAWMEKNPKRDPNLHKLNGSSGNH